jgi:molybdopterin-guanine dinucleotide biosynthesis protein A
MSRRGQSDSGVTAVILAGGMSRRLGRNKALEPFQGEPLIQRVIARMRQVGESLIVVVNDPERAAELDLPEDVATAVDRYPGMGSLGGILTGLVTAPTEWSTFCACDMPFLNPQLYQLLLSLRDGYDAVVPVVDGRPEPTHAVYSRACVEPIRERIIAKDLKISSFFGEVRVCLVPEEQIRRSDPELLSFFNVNTQEDLTTALSIAARTPVQ